MKTRFKILVSLSQIIQLLGTHDLGHPHIIPYLPAISSCRKTAQILLATWDAFRLVILADGPKPQPKTSHM